MTRPRHAMPPPSLVLARAMIALVDENPDDWQDLTVEQVAGHLMKHSNGKLNPVRAREAFRALVREAGLDPIE